MYNKKINKQKERCFLSKKSKLLTLYNRHIMFIVSKKLQINFRHKKERFRTLFLHTNHLNLGAYSKIKTHF